ncbi:hypothetical protein EMIHUDRAFT_230922 [Emiliania huxleyi CCMP1516]|uniref:Uncharacterized protein n=2 Tax=Emiliania huxleyi TaxID=2903 RepID=A0A0D3K9E4_EMIH1|nr:hypothetical protein EMIHUDRAFT_230922 [Emiliania huxleyi CCMP1516]EOD32379.1 hypothetical protein EMIHUDRAFT_230922 [Emiliania huxleyi CCMP1516]|eukprot:XP_005784808.1 hypothetical protein EMIHUDRAFT_230922 [Emiliania huxleyi CCMP1516]
MTTSAKPRPSPILAATFKASCHLADDSSDAHCDHLPPSHIVAQGWMMPALDTGKNSFVCGSMSQDEYVAPPEVVAAIEAGDAEQVKALLTPAPEGLSKSVLKKLIETLGLPADAMATLQQQRTALADAIAPHVNAMRNRHYVQGFNARG